MDINITQIISAALYIDNTTIEGKILDFGKKGERIVFELLPNASFFTSETGKRAELFFEQEGRKYFIAGKVFFQPPSRVIITPETDTQIERRSEKRLETQSLLAVVSYTHGVFHKKHVMKGTIISMSIKGVRVETRELLSNDMSYEINTSLPFHHVFLEFNASFVVRNSMHYRNTFISGAMFTGMNIESENNLKKYLFGRQIKF